MPLPKLGSTRGGVGSWESRVLSSDVFGPKLLWSSQELAGQQMDVQL